MKKSKEIRQLEKEFNCRIRPYKNPPEGLEKTTGWWPDKNAIGINLRDFNKLTYKILKASAIIHELQHQYCCRSHCFCWTRKSSFWWEYHAIKAEFEYLCNNINKKNYKIIIHSTLATLQCYLMEGDIAHYKAMKKVLKIKRIRERLGLK